MESTTTEEIVMRVFMLEIDVPADGVNAQGRPNTARRAVWVRCPDEQPSAAACDAAVIAAGYRSYMARRWEELA